ncbi:membrane dipeptidase [Oscillospiraceae bacterium PP1C4]
MILFIIITFFICLGFISFYLPIYIQKSSNAVYNNPQHKVSEKAMKLHNQLIVADMHADSLLLNRNLLKKSNIGHIDIPRLVQGNVAIQAFTVVTKAPSNLNIDRNDSTTDTIKPLAIIQRWPVSTWFSLKERAVFQAKKLHKIQADADGNFIILKTHQDLEEFLSKRNTHPHLTAGFLGLEGLHALEGNINNVDVLYNEGFRMMGLTHFFDNDISGSLHGIDKGGLTPLGKEVVQRMDKLGIIIDLSHISDKAFKEICNLVYGPIVVSHTGVKGVKNNNLNLSDEKIKLIADKKGVIGIGFFERATGGTDVNSIIKSINYVVDLVGVDYVCLGSDFDGYVKTSIDCSGMSMITEALLVQGYTENEIKKIMGENVLRVLKDSFPSRV